MIEEVIILTLSKFNERDYNRFGVKKFLDKGFKVTVLDFSSILRSKHYSDNNTQDINLEFKNIVTVNSISDFNEFLIAKKGDKIFALPFFHLFSDSKEIFKMLSNYNIKYAVIFVSVLPDIRSKLKSFVSKAKYFFQYNLFERSLKAADIAIFAGKKGKNLMFAKISNKTTFIEVGSYDYLNFKENEKEILHSRVVADKYFVFLDEYYPLHPDLNGKFLIDVNEYYSSVNKYLKQLQELTGFACVIAAHPRAFYEVNPFEFEVIQQKTMELVYHSEFVVGHASTSFSYPVLFEKPISQIGFYKLRLNYYGIYLIKIAKLLNNKITYLDMEYDLILPKLDRVANESYKQNYIISEDHFDANFTECVINYLLAS